MTASDQILIKEFLVDNPQEDTGKLFIFAHGAGKGMSTPFMETIAKGLSQSGIRVLRFHFPYMEEMVRSGTKRPPNGGAVLRQSYSEVIAHCAEKEGYTRQRIFIGGKSMGGRIASMIADEHQVAGVVCFGYPFHPPRKPEKLRVEHLLEMTTPMLICQGERDSFGHRVEVGNFSLSEKVEFSWIKDGDHSFAPRKSSGLTLEDNIQSAITASSSFILRQ